MAATDPLQGFNQTIDSPARSLVAVSPSDSADLSFVTKALWIGVGGNVQVIDMGGTTTILVGCQAGQIIPVRVARVMATNTTATSIVAMY